MGKKPSTTFDDYGIPTKQSAATPAVDPGFDEFGIPTKTSAVKKKAGTDASSITGPAVSPAAEYQQSITDLNTNVDELEKIHINADAIYDVASKTDPKDPQFKALDLELKDLQTQGQRKASQIENLQTIARNQYKVYQDDNSKKQKDLFDILGLDEQAQGAMRKEVFKKQHPELAEQIDAGTVLPTTFNVDAEDLSKAITGKSFSDVKREAAIRDDRGLMDRTFGSFVKSVEKTLAFELPAAAAATFSNTMAGLKKSATYGLLNEAIKATTPGVAPVLDVALDELRVDSFKWAKDWKDQNAAAIKIPGTNVPLVFENDKNMVQSIGQIRKPLDAIDFVASSIGQGAAQILPSVATRGGTSFIQEIGHNYLDGVIAKAEKTGRSAEDLIRSGEDEDDIARTFGIAQGLMESVSAGRIMKSIGYQSFKDDLQKRSLKWLKSAGESAATEFGTETLQGIGNQVSTAKMTGLGTIDAVKNVNWLQALDEGVAGAIGGAGVSAGGTLTHALANRIGYLKNLEVKKNKTPEEVKVEADILDEVADAAVKQGDPRPKQEIIEFVKKDVLGQIEADEKANAETTPESQPRSVPSEGMGGALGNQDAENETGEIDVKPGMVEKPSEPQGGEVPVATAKPAEVVPPVIEDGRKKGRAGQVWVKPLKLLRKELEEFKERQARKSKDPGLAGNIRDWEREIAEQERLGLDEDAGRIVTVTIGEESESVVPPVTELDSPGINRERGYVEQDGVKYERQEPITKVVKGKDTDIVFSPKVSQKGNWAVVEADEIQPSHQKGNRNLSHFISEAQPKKRDSSYSTIAVKGAQDIAGNLKPAQITDSPNAYFGAPTVNSRGEVIQGNSRADALQQYYQNDPADSKGYKQFLVDSADQFGLDADQVTGFSKPVLVRMAPVEDPRAIELGQYDVKDLETGGARRIDSVATIGKMNQDDATSLSNIISQTEGDTLSEIIRKDTGRIVDFLYKKGLINESQIETILNRSTGSVNAKGVEDLTSVVRGLIFKGGNPDLANMFEQLPHSVKAGLDKAIPSILRTGKMTKDIQQAIAGYAEYRGSGATSVKDWSNQSDMFKGGIAPISRFTPNQLRLIKLFDSKSQGEITSKIRQINQLMQGTDADMFSEAKPGMKTDDAVGHVLGRESSTPVQKIETPVKEKPSANKSKVEDIEKRRQADLAKFDKANIQAYFDKRFKKQFPDGVKGGDMNSIQDNAEVFQLTPEELDMISSFFRGTEYEAKRINKEYDQELEALTPKPALIKVAPTETIKPEQPERTPDEIDALFGELGDAMGISVENMAAGRKGLDPKLAVIGGRIVEKYIDNGILTFGEIARDVYNRYGEEKFYQFYDALKAGYGSNMLTMEDISGMTPITEVRKMPADKLVDLFKTVLKDTPNESGTAGDLESDSERDDFNQPVGTKNVPEDQQATPPSATPGKERVGSQVGGPGDLGFSNRISPPGSKPANSEVDGKMGTEPISGRVGRGTDYSGGREVDESGVQPDKQASEEPDDLTADAVEGGRDITELVKQQEWADRNVKPIAGDIQNIRQSVPILLPHQADNVRKTEERFFNVPKEGSPNKGIMFTDATGTGKTFTGLGIIKRYEQMGKNKVLLVVPTDSMAKNWQRDAKLFGMDVHQLSGITDAARDRDRIVTTYANFRANEALLARARNNPFDLVIYDESHRIISNADGSATNADNQHKKLTFSPDEAARLAREKYQAQIDKEYKEPGYLSEMTKGLIKKETDRLREATKVVFLSATPFAYHKTLDYADGYLYTITEGEVEKEKAYRSFFIKNFGYQIKYNKLQSPEIGIDQGLMERQFNSMLKKQGAISSTRLNLDKDYSRDFVLIDDKLGSDIDEGYKMIYQRKANGSAKYPFLSRVADKKFNYLYQSQLLEAIKAKQSIDRIQQHLDLKRKVIVFHGYNYNLPSHPFDFSDQDKWPISEDLSAREIQDDIEAFHSDYPQFADLDLREINNPIETITKAFPGKTLVFNGTVPKSKRIDIIRSFNDDNSGKDIIVIQQEAGKEGISLHDITGIFQRAMMNMALPIKPTDAIQTEGRPYRYGVKSNAVLEYPVLHLGFEKNIFAFKVNQRVKTAENLAFGEEARNLETAFKEGYKSPTTDDPSDKQGVGGKESDGSFDTMDDFDRAITFYIARGKRNAKTKSREGTDYYATPEPLGLKMVEWLHLRPNDHALEPSAGHGAIARWFPEYTINKFVEPSYELRGDLAINSMGEVEPMNFEDYHIINKFDGIAMNPPYGSGGKTAMDHVKKGLIHLKDGGRLIAIVPDGPAMQKRIDEFFEAKDSKGYYTIATVKLPSVTFKRAGTEVNTQLLIIEKQITDMGAKKLPESRNIDLSGAKDINEFFDRIRKMEMPVRGKPSMESVGMPTTPKKVDPVTGIAKKDAEVIPTKHTKLGHAIWVVKMNRFLSRDEYNTAKARADEYGGYYSSFKGNGAIPGFIFRTAVDAENLTNFINGGFQRDPEDISSSNMMSVAANPSKGRSPLSAFEHRVRDSDGKPFKMFQRVIDLATKYNPDSTLGQGYSSRGALGSFYNQTRNVRLTGLNSLSVASHELAHALDLRYQVISNFLKNTTSGDPIRKQLTDLYVEYYPQAKVTDNARTRAVEGFATLVQKYLEFPTEIKAKYPDLVNEFLMPAGKYYFTEITEYLHDVDAVIADYQALSPLDKMGTRVVTTKINPEDDSWMTLNDRVTQQVFDHLYPLELLAKRDGTHYTQDDISLWTRLSNNALQMAEKNIASKRGEFWNLDPDGSFTKKLDFNYRTIEQMLQKEKKYEDFGKYLYARRIKFEWEKLHDLEDSLEEVSDAEYVEQLMADMAISQQAAEKMQAMMVKTLEGEIANIKSKLENEQVDEKSAAEAFDMAQPTFKKEEQMFDALTQQDLELAHNPLVGLLDDAGYELLNKIKGYSPSKRVWYDELLGKEAIPVVKGTGTKPGQFLKHAGSEKPVLNPFVGAQQNHAELMRKALKQMVYNKMVKVAEAHPDLFQILALKTSPDPTNRFPQEKDPNIIMARRKGKRVPILTDSTIKAVLDENYDYHNIHLIEKVGITMSQLFRTGTTGIFWQFFVNNVFLDQAAASINTRNGMVPFISSIKHVGPAVVSKLSEKLMGNAMLFPNSVEAAYLKEYLFLAGSSQTFLSADNTNRKNLEDIILGEEKSWAGKVASFFEIIARYLSLPGNATEIMTRGTEYIKARKAGKPQVVALEEAGRVSAPFHHTGAMDFGTGRSAAPYVRTVPYFNATLQVFKQTKDSISTKKGAQRYAFAALSAMAASAASVMYLLSLDDDDERKQTLVSMPPEEQSKYLFLPSPYSSTSLMRIRVPEQIGFMAGLQNMMLIELAGSTQYSWSEYGRAASSFLPQQINVFGGYQTLFSWFPQVVKPGFETAVGMKTYPGIRPIETDSDKEQLPELRFNRFTSPAAKILGEQFGMSPKKIDHFLEGTFGRSIKYVTGKGPYFLGDVFNKELYFESSKQVQFFYDVKQANDQKVKAWVDLKRTYSDDEQKRMFEIEDTCLDIQADLKEYGDLRDEDKEVEAVRLRNEIFTQIKELEKLVY